MEVKINKEIRNYTENIFFGLTIRQFICSLLACCMAVAIYFLFKDILHKEILSWLCVIGAIPFAVFGFVKYNGMSGEQLIKAIIKSEYLTSKKLVFEPTNFYYELINSMEVRKDNENYK